MSCCRNRSMFRPVWPLASSGLAVLVDEDKPAWGHESLCVPGTGQGKPGGKWCDRYVVVKAA